MTQLFMEILCTNFNAQYNILHVIKQCVCAMIRNYTLQHYNVDAYVSVTNDVKNNALIFFLVAVFRLGSSA